jgi:hypothetical protein
VNPAKWSVRRINPPSPLDRMFKPWHVFPPHPTDQHRSFATWRQAFDFADEMSRGLA